MLLSELQWAPRSASANHYFDASVIHTPLGNTIYVEQPTTEAGVQIFGRWIITLFPGRIYFARGGPLSWTISLEKWHCHDDLTAQCVLHHCMNVTTVGNHGK